MTDEGKTSSEMPGILTPAPEVPPPPQAAKAAESDSPFAVSVSDVYEGPLDPALFEVPHGFRHVEEIDHNSPRTPLSPVREFWERVKYTVANWFSFD